MNYTVSLTFEVKPDQMWEHRLTGKVYTIYRTIPTEIQCLDEDGYTTYFTPNQFFNNFRRRES